MIKNREIYQMQKDLEELKNSKPDLSITTGIKFNLAPSDFVLDESSNIYKATITHNLNVEIESFSVSFYNQNKESFSLDYRIINANSIEVQSDEAIAVIVSIKQAVITQDHNHDSTYSKLNHTHEVVAHTHNASNVNIVDTANKFEAVNVEEALLELKNSIPSPSSGGINYIETFEELKSRYAAGDRVFDIKPNCTIHVNELLEMQNVIKINGNGATFNFDKNLLEGLIIKTTCIGNVVNNLRITSNGSSNGIYYDTSLTGHYKYCIKLFVPQNGDNTISNCVFEDIIGKVGLITMHGVNATPISSVYFKNSGLVVQGLNGGSIVNIKIQDGFIYERACINTMAFTCTFINSQIYNSAGISTIYSKSNFTMSHFYNAYEMENNNTTIESCAMASTIFYTGALDGSRNYASIKFVNNIEHSDLYNMLHLSMAHRFEPRYKLHVIIPNQSQPYKGSGVVCINGFAGTQLSISIGGSLSKLDIRNITCDINAIMMMPNAEDNKTLNLENVNLNSFSFTGDGTKTVFKKITAKNVLMPIDRNIMVDTISVENSTIVNTTNIYNVRVNKTLESINNKIAGTRFILSKDSSVIVDSNRLITDSIANAVRFDNKMSSYSSITNCIEYAPVNTEISCTSKIDFTVSTSFRFSCCMNSKVRFLNAQGCIVDENIGSRSGTIVFTAHDSKKINSSSMTINTGLTYGLKAKSVNGTIIADKLQYNSETNKYKLTQLIEDTISANPLDSPIITEIEPILSHGEYIFKTPIPNFNADTFNAYFSVNQPLNKVEIEVDSMSPIY